MKHEAISLNHRLYGVFSMMLLANSMSLPLFLPQVYQWFYTTNLESWWIRCQLQQSCIAIAESRAWRLQFYEWMLVNLSWDVLSKTQLASEWFIKAGAITDEGGYRMTHYSVHTVTHKYLILSSSYQLVLHRGSINTEYPDLRYLSSGIYTPGGI